VTLEKIGSLDIVYKEENEEEIKEIEKDKESSGSDDYVFQTVAFETQTTSLLDDPYDNMNFNNLGDNITSNFDLSEDLDSDSNDNSGDRSSDNSESEKKRKEKSKK